MTLFPESFFAVLIYAALVLSCTGTVWLIVLFVRDYGRKKLW